MSVMSRLWLCRWGGIFTCRSLRLGTFDDCCWGLSCCFLLLSTPCSFLQDELDAYDKHNQELEEKFDEKNAALIHLKVGLYPSLLAARMPHPSFASYSA